MFLIILVPDPLHERNNKKCKCSSTSYCYRKWIRPAKGHIGDNETKKTSLLERLTPTWFIETLLFSFCLHSFYILSTKVKLSFEGTNLTTNKSGEKKNVNRSHTGHEKCWNLMIACVCKQNCSVNSFPFYLFLFLFRFFLFQAIATVENFHGSNFFVSFCFRSLFFSFSGFTSSESTKCAHKQVCRLKIIFSAELSLIWHIKIATKSTVVTRNVNSHG